ncbi:hypothetical protein RUE5091_04105 [Ruegeria denitrificans]|uniref:Uncharacterized protein n=1 Tax=Ruegeria denitrificans TaxID=1715692 RepID=A0A0P1IJK0_9RHOB|nr:hypothetical protein [Ruegeria denitrificans]CUK17338.1 hypothetical protein RUE5091_04105 [Ruegeria denitrificans]
MFSPIGAVSLLELRGTLGEILTYWENRDVFHKICKEIGYEYEDVDGLPYIRDRIEPDGSVFPAPTHLGASAFGYVIEDVFKLFLIGTDRFHLCSPSGEKLVGSNLFLELLDLNYEAEEFSKFTKHNFGCQWFFLEYPTYLISTKNWDRFSKDFLIENNLIDPGYVLPIAERVRSFEGWSLCVVEDDIPKTAQDCLSLVEFNREKRLTSKRGRPSLEKARAAFAAMGNNKGSLSWTQVQNRLENQTGQRPSPKTLRDWRDAASNPRGKK